MVTKGENVKESVDEDEVTAAAREVEGTGLSPYEILVRRAAIVARQRTAAARPVMKDEGSQTDDPENSAPCGETHGTRRSLEGRLGRLEHLTGKLVDVQLQEAGRRRRAEKARRRRERRREKRVASANGPGGGEAGPDAGLPSEPRMVPTETWVPPADDRPEADVVGSESEAGVGCAPSAEEEQTLSGDSAPGKEVGQRDPEGFGADGPDEREDHRLLDARRLLRAAKKVTYDLLREQRTARQQVEEPAKVIRVYVTLADQVGLKHMEHRVGRREVHALRTGEWYKFRKKLIQRYRLKSLQWNLWLRDGIAWACLPKVPQVADGDELRLDVWGRKKSRQNSPNSSSRRHLERANQKRSKKSFTWSPPAPRSQDVATSVKLAPAGQIGYRELPDRSPEEDAIQAEERRTRAVEALRARKTELSSGLAERSKVMVSSPPDDEEVRKLKREVEQLEAQQGAKQRLDDRDEWRRKKDEKFRKEHVEPPPERFVPRAVEERAAATKRTKAEEAEAFRRQLEEQRAAKAKRQEDKKAEGQARQAKAEKRTGKKKGWTGAT
jgi:hypothetical protein